MKAIKKILFNVLSQRSYLKTLHRSFYFLYRTGLLKGKQSFKYHYMVRELIQPSDTVVDIGANLGYFCKTFSRLTPNGKVIAIEPVPAFYEILTYFLGNRKNVTIHNVALGKEPGTLSMVLPESDGMIRTGLPHIARDEEEKQGNKTVDVAIVRGSELLGKEPKINYIKCDIEGYERVVFEEIQGIIEQHRPLVQVEVAQENEPFFVNYFAGLDYLQYGIKDFRLVKDSLPQQEHGDFLFIPKEKADAIDRQFSIQ